MKKSIEKYWKSVKDALKEKGFGGGFLNNTNSKLISRFARILKDEADQEMSDFIDEKDRPMTRLEIKQMYRRLEDLLFLEVDILNEDEVGVRVPQINAIGIEGDIPNPFSDARRKPKKNKSNSSNNEIFFTRFSELSTFATFKVFFKNFSFSNELNLITSISVNAHAIPCGTFKIEVKG